MTTRKRNRSSSTSSLTRRRFVQSTAGAAAAASLGRVSLSQAAGDKPAALGGTPVRRGPWPSWPVSDETDVQAVAEVVRSGNWFRYKGDASTVDQFESQWSRAVGSRFCQATNSGTSAMITSLAALAIGPGDEVLVPPYTFIATVNAVLLHHALPVFVDTDPTIAQLDSGRIAERINGNTRCILPVHYGGSSCDMDQLMQIARQRSLHVVEDACQAHTGEWHGRRLGTLGDTGCFSFQSSKLLTSGDGGVLVTDNEMLYYRAQAFHNNGNGRFEHDNVMTGNGGNFRMTQFQGALLQEQLKRLDGQARRREANAAYLNDLLSQVPGVTPKKRLQGTTRHGCFLFVFDYDPDAFAGMDKTTFRRALRAEGIPVTPGYPAINQQPWVERFLTSRGFRRIYGARRLKRWRDENDLPANDRMILTTCRLSHTVLLAQREDMEKVATACARVQKHAAAIAKAS